VNDIFPEWNIWTQFVSAIYDGALRSDALASSHAIEVRPCGCGWALLGRPLAAR